MAKVKHGKWWCVCNASGVVLNGEYAVLAHDSRYEPDHPQPRYNMKGEVIEP